MKSARYFVTVTDDSMAPRIPAGARVLIDPDQAVKAGDKGLFDIGGQFQVVRELAEVEGQKVLRALDPNAAGIVADEDVKALGRATQISIAV